MTITQTVEIPENRRLVIDVPREIPGKSVVLTFAPASAITTTVSEALPGSSGNHEETPQAGAETTAYPNRKPISYYFGIFSPDTFGDGVAYQRKLRDEWDD